jgi:hypothetical protein
LSESLALLELAIFCRCACDIANGDDAWDEVLFFFDSVLVSLSGALDAIATLAHQTYRLAGPARFASWRSQRRWIPELRKIAPDVAAMTDDGRHSRAVIDVLALLRNSIHGPALSGRLYDRNGRVGIRDFMRTTLAFDGEEAAEIRAALDVLSSENVRWGSWDHDDRILLVHPGRFAEAAVAAATGVARDLLQAMDTVQIATADAEPPEGWLPEQRYQDNALLLIGLGSLDSTTLR